MDTCKIRRAPRILRYRPSSRPPGLTRLLWREMEAHDAAEPEPLHTEESDQGPPMAPVSDATHREEEAPGLDSGMDAFMPSHYHSPDFFEEIGGNVSLSHYLHVHLLTGTHRKLHCTTRFRTSDSLDSTSLPCAHSPVQKQAIHTTGNCCRNSSRRLLHWSPPSKMPPNIPSPVKLRYRRHARSQTQ
jgi:hypothetical protein